MIEQRSFRTYGDGDECPDSRGHGRMYTLGNGQQWCPHADHYGALRPEQVAGEKEIDRMATDEQVKAVPKPTRASRSKATQATTPAATDRTRRSRATATAEPKPAPRARATAETREMPLCKCGCGERTKGGIFRPGHDARYHSAQKKAAAETAAKAEKKAARAASKS
jgi:hypothetical protein